ncbi:MAG: Xaa-Pro peptidase family protein [Verrucomicrobiota bacterium]
MRAVAPPSLDPVFCRGRQSRLRRMLGELSLNGAVFFNRHYIYALSGYWHEQPLTPTALWVPAEGEITLVNHSEEADVDAVNKIVGYVPNKLFTLKENLAGEVASALLPHLPKTVPIGTDNETPAAMLERIDCRDISAPWQRLRRRKDPDEVAALEFTIDCAERAYEVARQMVEPGIPETEIMAAMLEEATFSAGEFLSGWGQDFRAGVPGGFARRQEILGGELIPLDIGVGVRGYRSDLCRTFAIGGQPSEEQAAAHAHILEVMTFGESMMRPGQSCAEFHTEIHARLDGWNGYAFIHHAGHGIGLDAHEVPRLNSHWDDTLEVGDVLAFEPGLYHESLRGGIRLENNYLITEEGFRQLSHYPLGLV